MNGAHSVSIVNKNSYDRVKEIFSDLRPSFVIVVSVLAHAEYHPRKRLVGESILIRREECETCFKAMRELNEGFESFEKTGVILSIGSGGVVISASLNVNLSPGDSLSMTFVGKDPRAMEHAAK